jgi:hypothetical protein
VQVLHPPQKFNVCHFGMVEAMGLRNVEVKLIERMDRQTGMIS